MHTETRGFNDKPQYQCCTLHVYNSHHLLPLACLCVCVCVCRSDAVCPCHQACADYRDLVSTHGRKWQRMFQHEREQRSRLEQMVEQLARQHSHLENEAKQLEHKHIAKKDSLTGGGSRPRAGGSDVQNDGCFGVISISISVYCVAVIVYDAVIELAVMAVPTLTVW